MEGSSQLAALTYNNMVPPCMESLNHPEHPTWSDGNVLHPVKPDINRAALRDTDLACDETVASPSTMASSASSPLTSNPTCSALSSPAGIGSQGDHPRDTPQIESDVPSLSPSIGSPSRIACSPSRASSSPYHSGCALNQMDDPSLVSYVSTTVQLQHQSSANSKLGGSTMPAAFIRGDADADGLSTVTQQQERTARSDESPILPLECMRGEEDCCQVYDARCVTSDWFRRGVSDGGPESAKRLKRSEDGLVIDCKTAGSCVERQGNTKDREDGDGDAGRRIYSIADMRPTGVSRNTDDALGVQCQFPSRSQRSATDTTANQCNSNQCDDYESVCVEVDPRSCGTPSPLCVSVPYQLCQRPQQLQSLSHHPKQSTADEYTDGMGIVHPQTVISETDCRIPQSQCRDSAMIMPTTNVFDCQQELFQSQLSVPAHTLGPTVLANDLFSNDAPPCNENRDTRSDIGCMQRHDGREVSWNCLTPQTYSPCDGVLCEQYVRCGEEEDAISSECPDAHRGGELPSYGEGSESQQVTVQGEHPNNGYLHHPTLNDAYDSQQHLNCTSKIFQHVQQLTAHPHYSDSNGVFSGELMTASNTAECYGNGPQGILETFPAESLNESNGMSNGKIYTSHTVRPHSQQMAMPDMCSAQRSQPTDTADVKYSYGPQAGHSHQHPQPSSAMAINRLLALVLLDNVNPSHAAPNSHNANPSGREMSNSRPSAEASELITNGPSVINSSVIQLNGRRTKDSVNLHGLRLVRGPECGHLPSTALESLKSPGVAESHNQRGGGTTLVGAESGLHHHRLLTETNGGPGQYYNVVAASDDVPVIHGYRLDSQQHPLSYNSPVGNWSVCAPPVGSSPPISYTADHYSSSPQCVPNNHNGQTNGHTGSANIYMQQKTRGCSTEQSTTPQGGLKPLCHRFGPGTYVKPTCQLPNDANMSAAPAGLRVISTLHHGHAHVDGHAPMDATSVCRLDDYNNHKHNILYNSDSTDYNNTNCINIYATPTAPGGVSVEHFAGNREFSISTSNIDPFLPPEFHNSNVGLMTSHGVGRPGPNLDLTLCSTSDGSNLASSGSSSASPISDQHQHSNKSHITTPVIINSCPQGVVMPTHQGAVVPLAAAPCTGNRLHVHSHNGYPVTDGITEAIPLSTEHPNDAHNGMWFVIQLEPGSDSSVHDQVQGHNHNPAVTRLFVPLDESQTSNELEGNRGTNVTSTAKLLDDAGASMYVNIDNDKFDCTSTPGAEPHNIIAKGYEDQISVGDPAGICSAVGYENVVDCDRRVQLHFAQKLHNHEQQESSIRKSEINTETTECRYVNSPLQQETVHSVVAPKGSMDSHIEIQSLEGQRASDNTCTEHRKQRTLTPADIVEAITSAKQPGEPMGPTQPHSGTPLQRQLAQNLLPLGAPVAMEQGKPVFYCEGGDCLHAATLDELAKSVLPVNEEEGGCVHNGNSQLEYLLSESDISRTTIE